MPRLMSAKAPKPAAKAPVAPVVAAVAAPDLVKILILRSHPLYAYSAGDTGELNAADAEFLVTGGFAQLAI